MKPIFYKTPCDLGVEIGWFRVGVFHHADAWGIELANVRVGWFTYQQKRPVVTFCLGKHGSRQFRIGRLALAWRGKGNYPLPCALCGARIFRRQSYGFPGVRGRVCPSCRYNP